jgi:hypothetical protein
LPAWRDNTGHNDRILLGSFYTDTSGVCVRTGRRQSMPSSNIDS